MHQVTHSYLNDLRWYQTALRNHLKRGTIPAGQVPGDWHPLTAEQVRHLEDAIQNHQREINRVEKALKK